MRRWMRRAGDGPLIALLVVVLLAACGQPEITPTTGQGAAGATPIASPATPGTPATPRPPTPLTPTRAVSSGTPLASPTRPPGSATPAGTPATPDANADATLRALLAALPEARAIGITDDWTGLSQDAPIEAHYRLARQGDDFAGTMRFVAGGYGNAARAATADVTVPAATARAFLALLAQTPLRAGQYRPINQHTDDYPAIIFRLETPAGQIAFGTSSNSPGHVPWWVAFAGGEYVADNDTPTRAYKLIEPSLRSDVRQRVVGARSGPAEGVSTGTDPLFCRVPSVPGDPLGQPARPTGATINMAQDYELARLTGVSFARGRAEWREPERIAGLVALFDRPIALIDPPSSSSYDRVELFLKFSDRDYFYVLYNPHLDTLYWQRDPPARNRPIYTVAPSGFRELVLREVCGR